MVIQRTSEHLAFVSSTDMRLPVADKRVTLLRGDQAVAVAIAVVAATCGLPFPPQPPSDSRYRSADDLARQAGLEVCIRGWTAAESAKLSRPEVEGDGECGGER